MVISSTSTEAVIIHAVSPLFGVGAGVGACASAAAAVSATRVAAAAKAANRRKLQNFMCRASKYAAVPIVD
jgi:hypothetical protein